ncbi:TetR/AcrR family transcriptional regulator [Tetragenococcus halophilus]|uniref:TetR/AcrR family transcriptional regulator n=1 Tax=Tetragenococcus halophilus TaxID=51669 RepID=UPI0030EA3EE2
MKERIIEDFVKEMETKGMKFTMDDLVHRIGISKRTLYEHFSSKAEILEVLIDETIAEVNHKTENVLQNEELSTIQKLRKVITMTPGYRILYDQAIFEQIKRSYPDLREKLSKIFHIDWDKLHVLIHQGIQEGTIADRDENLIVKMIMEAVYSVHDQEFYIENNISMTDAISQTADIILFGILSTEENRG